MNTPSDGIREMRLTWIRLTIKATEAASRYKQTPEQIEEAAVLAYHRFDKIKTEDLSEFFDYGQKCLCATVDDFFEAWNVKLEERRRDAEIARNREQAIQEQARLTSPHPNRDAAFAQWREWGFI